MNVILKPEKLLTHAAGDYRVRLASTADDIKAAQRLRFEVFNVELNEGLAESFVTRLDADPFDDVCDHLLVEREGMVVGTYRLQTGIAAGQNIGYYSEQEFAFGAFERAREEIVELGRACVDRHHRNLLVLGLLWKGIAAYARANRARYLIGCSSLSSQNAAEGASAYSDLVRRHLAPMEWRTSPTPQFECALTDLLPEPPPIPKLMRAYLSLGAWICGPPALDAQFKTIDFLTLLDLENLPALVRTRLLSA